MLLKKNQKNLENQKTFRNEIILKVYGSKIRVDSPKNFSYMKNENFLKESLIKAGFKMKNIELKELSNNMKRIIFQFDRSNADTTSIPIGVLCLQLLPLPLLKLQENKTKKKNQVLIRENYLYVYMSVLRDDVSLKNEQVIKGDFKRGSLREIRMTHFEDFTYMTFKFWVNRENSKMVDFCSELLPLLDLDVK